MHRLEDRETDIMRGKDREGDNPTFPPRGEYGQREKKKQEAKQPKATILPLILLLFFSSSPFVFTGKPSFSLIYIHTSYGASHRAITAQYCSHAHTHTQSYSQALLCKTKLSATKCSHNRLIQKKRNFLSPQTCWC